MNVFNENHLLKEADHQFKRDQADGKRQDNPFSYGYETKWKWYENVNQVYSDTLEETWIFPSGWVSKAIVSIMYSIQ